MFFSFAVLKRIVSIPEAEACNCLFQLPEKWIECAIFLPMSDKTIKLMKGEMCFSREYKAREIIILSTYHSP